MWGEEDAWVALQIYLPSLDEGLTAGARYPVAPTWLGLRFSCSSAYPAVVPRVGG
jgi:hypothetical protein